MLVRDIFIFGAISYLSGEDLVCYFAYQVWNSAMNNTHFTWIFDEFALAKVNFMTTTQNDDAKLSPRDQILKSDFDVGGQI